MKIVAHCYAITYGAILKSIRITGLFMVLLISFMTGCTKSEYTEVIDDKTLPTVKSVTPSDESVAVPTSVSLTVTFSEKMDTASIDNTTFTLNRGTQSINGTLTASDTTLTFKPSQELEGNTLYTITVQGVKDIAGNQLASQFVWSFTTAAAIDVKAPAVTLIAPVSNANGVQTNIKPSATFSEPMNNSTLNNSTFLLKKGTSSVTGTVSISGNTATFTPSAALSANSQYSATITTAVKDIAGNQLASAYTWNFTTGSLADVTPPSISSVSPVSNSTGVQVDIKPSVTFSEPMNAATINTSSITLKQGSAVVAGTVSMTGNVATFTPSAALSGNTLYTVSVSTAVKDAAGNSMATAHTWTFTTASVAPVAKSFSTDVVPVLNKCNECHRHNWTPSTTASTFHANLVSSGHINLTTPTSGKIYQKVNGGHPSSGVTAEQKTTVLTWIKEGSKNN